MGKADYRGTEDVERGHESETQLFGDFVMDWVVGEERVTLITTEWNSGRAVRMHRSEYM